MSLDIGKTDALERTTRETFETPADDPAAVPEDPLQQCRVVAPSSNDDRRCRQLVESGIGTRTDGIGERRELGTAGDTDTEEPTNFEPAVTPFASSNDEASHIRHAVGSTTRSRSKQNDAETALATQRLWHGNIHPVAVHDFTFGLGQRRYRTRRQRIENLPQRSAVRIRRRRGGGTAQQRIENWHTAGSRT